MAAIEIANLLGAIPIAVTRGRAKAAALLLRGARVIFHAVADDIVSVLIEAASADGCIIIYGTLAGAVARSRRPC